MTTIAAPPITKSIFNYPPNFPAGVVNPDWVAWFQAVQANSLVYPTPQTGFALGWDAGGNLINVANTGADQTAAWTAADAVVTTNFQAADTGLLNGYQAGDAAIRSDLLNTAIGKGAALISYLAPYTGAVAATVADSLGWQHVNVKWFGAKGDGTTDDTAAMAAAHATGKVVYYPSGTYKFSTLPGLVQGGIVGDGQTQTILSSTDVTTADLITFTGVSAGGPGNSLNFKDFTVQVAPAQKTAGAAISISPVGGENTYASFHNVTTNYTPIGIDFVAASQWNVVGCNFLGYSVAGIQVANTYSTDAGDGTITASFFSTTYATGTCSGVLQRSSGGLRVANNKFLGGVYGYYMHYDVTSGAGAGHAPTSNLFICDNSFELYTGCGISFEQHGNVTFKNVVISGNEFGVMQGANAAGILTDSSAAWLSDLTITSNVFDMMAPAGFIVSIGLTNTNDVNISSNVFKFNGGATPHALALVGCTNVGVGKNTYSGLSNTPFSLSGNTNLVIQKDVQQATCSPSPANTGWSAYGSLYISPASGTVTFPHPFLGTLVADDIQMSLSGASGEVAAVVASIVTSGDTTTGFTYKVIGVFNNQTGASALYSAQGIL